MTEGNEKHTISRRAFHRCAASAGVAAAVAANGLMTGQGTAAPAQEQPFPDGVFVDFHTHLGQVWGNRPALTAGALVHWMNENGISQAVVHPLESPEAWDHPIPTSYILEQTESYRHRLIPAAYIDPRVISLSLGSRENVAPLLRRYVAYGARAFGEHKPGIPMADPLNMALYASVSEVGLPILFHMDSRRNMDEPGLPGLERVLQTFPDTAFVGHAHGFWASISGDATESDFQRYPETVVAPGGALVRLMEQYPNLYGDLGAGSGANAILRDLDFGREFIIQHADQLVWSTDYLMPGQNVKQFDLYHKLDLPEDVERKVFRDNARRLLALIT